MGFKTNQLLLQIRRQETGGREVTASSCYEKNTEEDQEEAATTCCKQWMLLQRFTCMLKFFSQWTTMFCLAPDWNWTPWCIAGQWGGDIGIYWVGFFLWNSRMGTWIRKCHQSLSNKWVKCRFLAYCPLKSGLLLTIDTSILWMTVCRGEGGGDRRRWMGTWQVCTTECAAYLHQSIDLFIYLSVFFCNVSCISITKWI